MDFISELFHVQRQNGVNIFATSRYNNEIAKMFGGCVSLNIRATDRDINLYLRGHMKHIQPDILDDELQHMIGSEVTKSADGM